MALIKCPECETEVSDQAKTCIRCGFPLQTDNSVRIKMPNNVVEGAAGLFSSRACRVTSLSGKTLWQGKHGENASFKIDKPMEIEVGLGSWGNPVHGTVEPGKKYAMVQDMGLHLRATFRLTEVDVIDSD